MKILITGGLGFIGSNLAEACVRLGHEVIVISKSDKKADNIRDIKDKVKLILKDVKDIKDEVKGVDRIFHFAGTTDNYWILEDPYKDIEANCVATIALLEACKKYNPSARIIFGSTFFVNGNPEKMPVNAETPCKPLGLYGATRLAGEHFCHIYNRVFDMNIAIIRFTNVFGIKEQAHNKKKAGFNYLINLALEGKEIPLYNDGNFVRDFIYVEDAVNGCLAVAEKGEQDKVYYIGRGERIKFKDMIDMVIEEAKGGKIKAIEPPEFHKKIGINDFVCDNSPLKKLGWKPKVSIQEGIRRTIEFYRDGGNGV
jgi:UDP-glucose 4-epimerase|tara:strand:+ start:661 stop:1596 length:936 start_codon:yes stop_codon:yes gene_type:complete